MSKCGAKLAHNEGTCGKKPEPGSKRCAQHGGRSTGPKSPLGRLQSASKWLTHGKETRAIRETRARLCADLRAVEERLFEQGLILGPRTRGRKPKYLLQSRIELWINQNMG